MSLRVEEVVVAIAIYYVVYMSFSSAIHIYIYTEPYITAGGACCIPCSDENSRSIDPELFVVQRH